MARSEGRKGLGNYWGFWFALIAVMFLVAVLAACSSNKKQDQAPLQPEPTATVAAEPTPGCLSPNSCEGCPIGHVDRAAETACLYRYVTITSGSTSFQRLVCKVMLQWGDIVEITGGPETISDPLYGGSAKYCTVKVLQGSIYAEDDGEWFVSWDACMYQTTLGERPVPDFEVGDKILLGYNFVLRSSPAGPPILDNAGQPIIVFGHWKAAITDGPALADGRYWYQVAIDEPNLQPLPLGWVPPEFQIPEPEPKKDNERKIDGTTSQAHTSGRNESDKPPHQVGWIHHRLP